MSNQRINIDSTRPRKASLPSNFALKAGKPTTSIRVPGSPNENSQSGIHSDDMAEVDRLTSLLRVNVLKAWKAKRENIMRNNDWTAMPQLFSEFLQLQECRLHMCVARLTFRLGLHAIARQSSETALFMLQDFASVSK